MKTRTIEVIINYYTESIKELHESFEVYSIAALEKEYCLNCCSWYIKDAIEHFETLKDFLQFIEPGEKKDPFKICPSCGQNNLIYINGNMWDHDSLYCTSCFYEKQLIGSTVDYEI